jgi:DNA polymerase elongation subunit (family B)
MYGSVYYDTRKSTIHWSEYDKEGNRSQKHKKWVPDFYVETKEDTKFLSQSGKKLKRVVESTLGKRRAKIKNCKETGFQIFGSDLSNENKFILETWPQDITEAPPVRFMFLDIEVECEDGFSDALIAKERINLISCWSTIDEIMYTFALEHDFKGIDKYPNVKYIKCRDERELLDKFLKYIERTRHDIWSGWNSSGYDVPYIFNRICRVLDDIDVDEHNEVLLEVTKTEGSKDHLYTKIKKIEKKMINVKRLSHYGAVKKKIQMKKDPFTKEMKPQMIYAMEGITDYDYMELDKQFRLGKRDSYKLDEVARDEIGETKVEYEGTLRDLYHNDWEKFVIYNIQDVMILVKLNLKLNYIPQAIALSYKCHCTFKDNFGTVQKAECAAYNFLMKDDIVLQDRVEKEKEHRLVPGGFVTKEKDLRRGMHRWIIDVDIASLYPSLMRGMNISYDTKIASVKFTPKCPGTLLQQPDDMIVMVVKEGEDPKEFTAKQVKQYIKKNDYHISAQNVIFKNITTDKGVLVKMLDMWYAQRKADKKLEAKYRQEAITLFSEASEVENGHEVEDNNQKKKLSDEDFEKYNECMRLSNVHFNLQWSCKILLNSVYGCLASDFSRFFGYDIAASITLSGQMVIKNNGEMLNNFFNNEFWDMPILKRFFPNIDHSIKEVEARLYTDTDSVYLTFDRVMDKLGVPNTDEDRLKTTKFLAKVTMNELEKYNEKFFVERFNAPNNIFWDQELIARTGIWCKPKKYVCHILEENGKPPKEDMLKKGLDLVRSSIPRKFKSHITEVVDNILKEVPREEIDNKLKLLYKESKKWTYDEIAIPSSCNNLSKYSNINGLNFLSGSPQHMKGAISFNYYLDYLKLKDYERLKEKDKFKMLFIAKNNRYTIDTIGYKDKLPKEFEMEDLIEFDRHFERGVIKPLNQIYDAIGWNFPETKNVTKNIDDLFM